MLPVLLLPSSSSSSSPLCRVFILIFLRQTVSPGNTVLQLFCCYYSWCLYRWFPCWIYCTFTLIHSEVCVQCPIWLFLYFLDFMFSRYVAHVFSEWLRNSPRETNKMQLIWFSLSNFYLNMFRASLCPSSVEQDCALPHMVFCTGCDGCGCVELGREL